MKISVKIGWKINEMAAKQDEIMAGERRWKRLGMKMKAESWKGDGESWHMKSHNESGNQYQCLKIMAV